VLSALFNVHHGFDYHDFVEEYVGHSDFDDESFCSVVRPVQVRHDQLLGELSVIFYNKDILGCGALLCKLGEKEWKGINSVNRLM